MRLESKGAKEATELLATSKGRTWALLHSWWILLTFTLGFFSWLAFLYIGLTARHPRWMLWALVYATPLIVFLIFAGFQVPHSWAFQLLNVNLILSIVSIVHAL